MTGQVPDAGPYIEQMDILVNASDPEPFGIVLLEGDGPRRGGRRRSTPAARRSSSRTAAPGMLARSGEPAALADALEPLLVSPELRRESRAAGPRALHARVHRRGDARALLRALPGVSRRAPHRRSSSGALAAIAAPAAPAEARPAASAPGADGAAEVTIVAHDVGSVGGMERQLAELVARAARGSATR